MKKIRFGQIHAHYVTMSQALDLVVGLVRSQSGGFIVTPNVDHVVLAERNVALRQAYAASTLSLADGMPLVWASRLLGRPLPAKISGSDFMGPLLERASAEQISVYFMGAAPGVAATAADKARRRYKGLRIAGVDSPPIGFDRDPDLENQVKQTMLSCRPDMVFVALGCPKQELLMHRWSRNGKMPVMLGVGASLDFLAGNVRRAPRVLSTIGLEWLFRLAQDPRRLVGRYLIRDLAIIPILLRCWRRRNMLHS